MAKLKPKEPLFSGRTVRESRRAEAKFNKDYNSTNDYEGQGARPVCPGMSQRRIKKAWAKHEAGRPLGRAETRLVHYFNTL